MLSVRRPVRPSRPSISVILFLPRKSERRLADTGRFSIVCGRRKRRVSFSSAKRRRGKRGGGTHADAVPAVLEVGQAVAVADALDLGELVLDEVQVREVLERERRVGRRVVEGRD